MHFTSAKRSRVDPIRIHEHDAGANFSDRGLQMETPVYPYGFQAVVRGDPGMNGSALLQRRLVRSLTPDVYSSPQAQDISAIHPRWGLHAEQQAEAF